MNQLELNNTGGFPFDTNTLEFIQSSYGVFNALSDVAGNLTILRGCGVTGSSVADGIVSINGEVLPFRSGTLSANVIIKEERTSLPFEDGQMKEVEVVRYATFGTGINVYKWADFKRINPIKELQRAVVPRGMICMWSGQLDDVPVGWQLCDGTNGTPDMRDRFVKGWEHDQSHIGEGGGSHEKTLSVDNLPSHNHKGKTESEGSHTHRYKDIYYSESWGTVNVPDKVGSNKTDHDNKGYELERTTELAGEHRHGFITEDTGKGKAFDVKPKYIELAFIMYMG